VTPRKTNSGPEDPWPNLGFTSLGGLDYVVPQYNATTLFKAGEWITQDGVKEEDKRYVGPHWVGELLKQLAGYPSIIRKLNRYSKLAPRSVYARNVALHLLARQEIEGNGGRKKALAHVAQAWRTKDKSVADCLTDRGADARAVLADIVQSVSTRPGASSDRLEILRNLDADLCYRANSLPWLSRRKKKKARAKSR
jgi:hypothetical protein